MTSINTNDQSDMDNLPGYSSQRLVNGEGFDAHDVDFKDPIVKVDYMDEKMLQVPFDSQAQMWKWFKKSLYIAINISASVGIIFYNKHALDDPAIKAMPMTVVAVHSLCTAGVMAIAARKPINLFEPVSTPIKSLFSLALAFPLYVVLGLMSIAYNPVAIYQLGKVMNSPAVALFNYLLFSTTVSQPIILSICVMCIGVTATIKGGWDTTTPIGLFFVVISTCAAASYQIGIGYKHKELKLSSPQLIYQQSRLSALLILPMIPFIDVVVNPMTLSWSTISGVIGTGLVASIVNLSQFLVIESTSALTFNVAGQLKTVSVIIIAWITADAPPSTLDYVGVFLAMAGSGAYAYISLTERKKAATQA